MARMMVRVFVITAATLISFAVSAAAPTIDFAAHRDFSAGYGPASIAVADVNGDQKADLVSANSLDDTVGVLLGNGDGTFKPPRSIYLGPNAAPRSVVVGDFNRDGIADLAVAETGLNAVSILPGNGDGTFLTSVNFAVGSNPICLVTADFNADALPDLIAVSTGSGTVAFLAGNGDGTLQTPRTLVTGGGASFVAVGEFNGDGRPDLALANAASGTVAALLSNGDGTFQTPQTFAAGPGVWSVAVGDFNRDGAQDLVAADNATNTVSVLLGNGNGTFQAGIAFVAGNEPTSVAVADFTGDGIADLAVGSEGSNTVSILTGDGLGGFSAPRIFAVGTITWAIATGNFNGDGSEDLAVANTYSTTISVLLGNGDGTFPASLSLAVGLNPEGLAAGDVNGDGRLDLVVSNAGSNSVSVLLGAGDGTFSALPAFAAGSVPNFAALGDLNGDGRLDLVLSNYGAHDYYSASVDSTVSVLLGNGDGTFQSPSRFEAGSGPHGIAIGDFNRDGAQDLAVADLGPFPRSIGTVAVLRGRGDGQFDPPQVYNAGLGLTGVATADFNNDNVLDLAVTSSEDATVAVLLGTGDGTFLPATSYGVGNVPKSVSVADVNVDGTVDLVVTDHYSDTVSILLGNGDGTFQPRSIVDTGRNPAWVAIGDFDADGLPDLAVANWFSTTVSVLMGKGDGTFWRGREFGAAAAPEKAVLGDFNRDGKPDIAVANYFAASVSVLINRTGVTRVARPAFTPQGGVYVGPQLVTLSVATPGATIHYTTDGSLPTAQSPTYVGPIPVARTTTIQAVAVASGLMDSAYAGSTYVIKAFQPTFSPSPGSYESSVTVTLRSATTDAEIHYTIDGTTPTASSPVYATPIAIARTTTFRAIAVASGMNDSAESNASYTLYAAAPAFSVPAGTYSQPQSVSLSTRTSGAAIHYTTDGSVPTAASPTYSGPIAISRTTTVRAVATAAGMTASTIAGATYTLQAAQPTYAPPPGHYMTPQFVEISCASPGATIYYTTDGSTPTTSSKTYTGSILVAVGTTIRSIAVIPGWSPSTVATGSYTILIQ